MSPQKTKGLKNRFDPRITVVVPVKNEVENLASLIEEICCSLKDIEPFEIIYVDDGSEDDTPIRLKELVKEFSELRAYRHEICCGQSAAILTGVQMAKGEVIVTIDGDGQNDPADIPKLLALYLEHEDPSLLLVSGYRIKRRDNFIKRLSSILANKIRAPLLGDNTPDTGCGLKVFAKKAFLSFPSFNHMHRFLPALMLRAGGFVTSVEVNHRLRTRGVSKYAIWDRLIVGIIDLLGVIWLKNRNLRPKTVILEDSFE